MLSTVNLNTPNIKNKRPEQIARSYKPAFGNVLQQTQVGQQPSFSGVGNFISSPVLSMSVLPKLKDPSQKDTYMELYRAADTQGKADLKFLLDTGKLLSNDADDGTTTLQNLQRIIKEPKANGLNAQVILNNALRALANPYSVTQDFGKLNANVSQMVMQDPDYAKIANAVGLNSSRLAFGANKQQPQQQQPQANLPAEYNVDASGTCVAASMEFNLADKRPAEFARYAADLSSSNMGVVENFKFSDINDSLLEAIYWLDQFNIQYEADGFEGGKILLRPDKGAYYRAISQTQQRDPGSRSPLDVLMQSTFMQLGSAASYNSLSDIRTGGFNQSNRGLTEFEKSMAEAVIDDNGGKSSVTYQIVDDNAFLQGYTKSYQETLMDLINSLKSGNNVIVGITETDANAKIVGGHEITVVASKIGKDGKLYFVCNDTDDNLDKPIEILADELIPKIHHAGIPNVVLKKGSKTQEQKPINIQIPPQMNPIQNQVMPRPAFAGTSTNPTKKSSLNLVA